MNHFTSIALGCLVVPAVSAQSTPASRVAGGPSLALPGAVAAGSDFVIEVLLTNVPGAPGNVVPGLNVPFKPSGGDSSFDRVYGSPNGNWIITALADLDTDLDEVLIVNGVMVQQEGMPAPWLAGVETSGSFDTQCDVNDAGDFTFATNVSGDVGRDEFIVTNVGGTWGFAAREGDPIPGVPPGELYGFFLESPVILANGGSGFAADFIDGAPSSTEDEILMLDGTVLLREGISVPPGQAGGLTDRVQNFDLSRFFATAAGDHWLVQADLDGSSSVDDVVIVDGTVVIQEGAIIPGSGFPNPVDTLGVVGSYMDEGGNWFARGDNDMTNLDWVVRNGTVIAQTDAPIFPGSVESYDDAFFTPCFFLHVGNANGDWVIGGMTDNPDRDRDGVLVLNGQEVILRESDSIDLDGNGMFDDDAFIDTIESGEVHLSDTGELIVVVNVKDGLGDVVGEAVLRLRLDGFGENFCTANPNSTGAAAEISAVGSNFVSQNSVILTATNLPPLSFGYFIVSRMEGFVANPGGSLGNLCLGGDIGRFVAPGQVMNSGVGGEISLTLDLTQIPQPNGPEAVMPGESWSFQTWHRDTSGGQPASNFTNGLTLVFI